MKTKLFVVLTILALGLVYTINVDNISAKPADVPSITSPSNGATDVSVRPNVVWSGSDIPFELFIDNNSNFASPEVHKTSLTGNSYQVLSSEQLATGTLYYAMIVDKDSQQSTVISFTTEL